MTDLHAFHSCDDINITAAKITTLQMCHKKKDHFVKMRSNNFDHISVISGNHIPKYN
jgi:hypothetical protein